jgi:hypothetical protein
MVLLWIVWIFSLFSIGHYAAVCASKPQAPAFGSSRGVALAATEAFADCLDKESGLVSKVALHFQKGSIQSPPPPPCYYVGRWKSTRLGLLYEVTLHADRSFIARSVKPRSDGVGDSTGSWIGEERQLTWLYDDGTHRWPPERTAVVDPGPDAFTVVERDGSRTPYERLERIWSEGCAAAGGPLPAGGNAP